VSGSASSGAVVLSNDIDTALVKAQARRFIAGRADNVLGSVVEENPMLELVISACLTTLQPLPHPTECREFSLIFDAHDVSLMTCMIHGQAQVAGWSATHHGWVVQKYHCRMAGAGDKRA
jgi:hypothetical protein